MSVQDIKDQIIGNKNKGSIEETLYQVMKEFGYTIQDLVGEEIEEENEIKIFGIRIFKWKKIVKREGMPYTTFQYLLKFMDKEAKEQNKQMNKSKRGKR